jgi:Na+-translocating ferredoxin:NAD+ oxidoreductase RnfA subunit
MAFGLGFFILEVICDKVMPSKFAVPLVTSRTFHTMITFMIAFLLTAYGFSVARVSPTVTSVDIRIKDLPARFDGFSIALLTDVCLDWLQNNDFVFTGAHWSNRL